MPPTALDNLWAQVGRISNRNTLGTTLELVEGATMEMLREIWDRGDHDDRNFVAIVWLEARKTPAAAQLVTEIELLAESW